MSRSMTNEYASEYVGPNGQTQNFNGSGPNGLRNDQFETNNLKPLLRNYGF